VLEGGANIPLGVFTVAAPSARGGKTIKGQALKKIIGCGVISILLMVLFLTNALYRFENMAQDRLYQDFGIIHPDIFVFGIDEETLIEFGPLQFWARQRVAEAIKILNSAPGWEPAVIAVDILYSGVSGVGEADEALVRAAEESGNVVFGAAVSRDFRGEVRTFERPFDALRQVSSYGLINGLIDLDGIVRRMEFGLKIEGEAVPTFAEAIYKMYTGAPVEIPENISSPMHLTFTGRPGDFYGTIGMGTSFKDIFAEDFDPRFFAGSIVLIGPFAHGLMDTFFTPTDLSQPMHGVEIHANKVQMLLDGNFKGHAPEWANLAIMLLVLIGFSFAFMLLDIRISFAALVVFAAGYVFLNRWIFDNGTIITLIYPIISIAALFVFSLVFRYIADKIAHITAIAEMNAKHFAEVKELFNSFVRVMTAAIDERTPYNANHTVTVAEYTKQFVRYLRNKFLSESPYHMDENREEELIMAAYLHDVGKIVTPIEIMDKASRLGDRLPNITQRFEIKKLYEKTMHLSGKLSKDEYNAQIEHIQDTQAFVEWADTAEFLTDEDLRRVKGLKQITYADHDGKDAHVFEENDIIALSTRKGTLTPAERGIMENHANVTERLLGNMKFSKALENVPNWAKSHHEFIDGTGYPRQLTEDQIPIEVRILTMVDIYDALTASDRPYKKAVSHEVAMGVLKSMARDGKLDGELVQLFADSGIGKMAT